jgi:hypothetical protein
MYITALEKNTNVIMQAVFFSSGKDRIVFATKEDLDKPCKANIVIEPPKDQPGTYINPQRGEFCWGEGALNFSK